MIDLTPSQLSTHGDVDTRQEEAQCASKRLGVQQRTNMLLPDGHIMDVPEYRILLATQIRIYKPEIVMMPWATDRHPDHEATAQLVKNAVFTA
ncbi:MAG: PIG-L family deacetylase [Candidatus Peribacteria bacterium]|nr:MAG: PIG-L family deacetylase [Candidatus Peribacteria bacterium]